MINLTITGFNATNSIATIEPIYSPPPACFDWCVVQHVVNANNSLLYGLFFVVMAYGFLVAIPYIRFTKYEELADVFEYMARIMLILFFGYFFLVIRWGIV